MTQTPAISELRQWAAGAVRLYFEPLRWLWNIFCDVIEVFLVCALAPAIVSYFVVAMIGTRWQGLVGYRRSQFAQLKNLVRTITRLANDVGYVIAPPEWISWREGGGFQARVAIRLTGARKGEDLPPTAQSARAVSEFRHLLGVLKELQFDVVEHLEEDVLVIEVHQPQSPVPSDLHPRTRAPATHAETT